MAAVLPTPPPCLTQDDACPLAWAHSVTREWFLRRFGSATEPQIAGWPAILAGEPTLISAPTGSGKTLAAFLVCLDALLRQAIAGALPAETQVVYVSPLKALSNDVQKNLDEPLREIQQLALERGFLAPEIRTGVRTGDTPTAERAAVLRNPPHILVTTPESLYILLTAGKSRENLRCVRTVIVDEIHAVAANKRGAHLALSLERLEALVRGENTLTPGAWLTGRAEPPQRIGLSATQNPLSLVAEFLTGAAPGRQPATMVQVGQRRQLKLAVEVPGEELGSIATTTMWQEMFDKLAACTAEHRSTLVFVNTRRLVEKIAWELAERLGAEHVAAHHGSLSRALRLDAEQRLKRGEIKILVATGSLELGIDIGSVDLVCQVNTTRNVAVAMQRVGRAGHWRGATPKGRFFATTRDDLLEQAALIRSMRAGELDRLEIPEAPIDVLMQQMVAACGAEPWRERELFAVLRRAHPYRDISWEHFCELLELLHQGIESSRGRYGSYLLRDVVHGELHPRRGARMTAIGNGGAIPDASLFTVVLQPEGVTIATLDEHFAVDSSPGDVVLLGNTSWRIQKIESTGRVLVEDAHGAPPTIPFWEGEAPQRTAVLSGGVGLLREEIAARVPDVTPQAVRASQPAVAACIAWLMEECCLCASGALQLVTYVVSGRAVLGAVPSRTTLIAERFFDDGGGMQLILHTPFGGRVNKAWGLALRKRFCRGFNFELQAAATDNGINISLAEQHSFPLSEVFQFLTEHTAQELLEQASITSPIFKNRWRWAAGRSLQLLRMQRGKRVAPQVQRTRSDDLMANVFPQAAACFETIVGDIQIPDHPLVREVMKDVLTEAMDIHGLNEILRGIASGAIRCLAVDSPAPSVFAHELLHAMPYAYLDEADAEARRARATTIRRDLPQEVAAGAGRLDPQAIATVRAECWPDLRSEHELHDLLLVLTALPLALVDDPRARDWPVFYERLLRAGRAATVDCAANVDKHCAAKPCWVATERRPLVEALWNTAQEPDAAGVLGTVQGWLQITGPTSAQALAARTGLPAGALLQAFLTMEMQGILLRGAFEQEPVPEGGDQHTVEWCERRILQRIHRLTLGTRRKQVEAVAPAVFMRWLLGWQHLLPGMQLAGEEGVLEALSQLEGFEAPAVEWERTLLPARVADYDPRWLDALCLSGAVGWGRISPHPAWSVGQGSTPRRVIPTNAAPITFFIRESADWLPEALQSKCVETELLAAALSEHALRVRELLAQRGACFANDLQRLLGLTRQETQYALWELATAGLAAADGFDQLRGMMDPRRKAVVTPEPTGTAARRGAGRTTAGRWSLLCEEAESAPVQHRQEAAIARARQQEAAQESAARMLLCRYGVLFRDLLERECNAPKWRELLPMLRRLEARGEVRGGRFVSGFSGEQFALPEAVESLRRAAQQPPENVEVLVAAADPMNLAGLIVPGERAAAVPGKFVRFRNGLAVQEDQPAQPGKPDQPAQPAQPGKPAQPATSTQPAATPPMVPSGAARFPELRAASRGARPTRQEPPPKLPAAPTTSLPLF